MKVSCNDKTELQRIHACYGLDFDDNILEVYAIAKFKKFLYLLRFKNSILKWYYSDLFDIVEDEVPDYWISKTFNFLYLLKNKQYDFSIPIKKFSGPTEFIDNPNFLFDIYDEPSQADVFLNEVMKKYCLQINDHL